eukprot:scaffold1.g5295.t1
MASDGAEAASINLVVKYGKESLDVSLPANATVQQLLDAIEARTGLFAHKQQKLMAKGRVVSGQPGATLAAAGIAAGAKLMLLAAAGTQTQGQATLASQQRQRQDMAAARRAAAAAGGGGTARSAPAAPPPGAMQQRAAAWARTGIASVRDMRLEELPAELLSPAVASAVRVLDAGGNRLAALPAALAATTGLQRLRLSGNVLGDGPGLDCLSALTQLTVLALDHNRLTALPACLGALPQLRSLSLSNNQLAALGPDVGRLTALRSLALAANRLEALPSELGACAALEEADLGSNRLEALPPELGRLGSLRTLVLDGNRRAQHSAGAGARLRQVPSELLSGCTSLATLSLHGNPITAEVLRETPGYQEYDARRRAKYSKQIGMKVLPGSFDEGADVDLWEHWK